MGKRHAPPNSNITATFVSLFFGSLHCAHSPFCLIPSCSQFAFSISKCFEASTKPHETELRDSLIFFLPYISSYRVISPASPLSPSPAYNPPFLLKCLYCSSEKKKKRFLERGGPVFPARPLFQLAFLLLF